MAHIVDRAASVETILAAIDGSSFAGLVVDRAVELGWARSSRIFLVHVVGPDARAVAIGERLTRRLECRVPQALRAGSSVVAGDVVARVCEAAESRAASVVVIGSHRNGWVERDLGPTAAGLVEHLERPLVIVRAGAADRARERLAKTSAELREYRARIDSYFAEVRDALRGEDWKRVGKKWNVFEPLLRFRLEVEERAWLCRFRAAKASEATALLDQHELLRRLLDAVGLGVEQQRDVRPAELDALVVALRDHDEREERRFLPWIEAHEGATSLAPTRLELGGPGA